MAEKIRNKAQLRKAAGIIIPVILIAVLVCVFLVMRYIPTDRRMPLDEYFNIGQESNEVIIIFNTEQTGYTGIGENGRLYMPQEFVQEDLNQRFYWDAETGGVIYADGVNIYTFMPDSASYTDDSGGSYQTEYPVLLSRNGNNYLAAEFVKEHSDIEYRAYADPGRMVIERGGYESRCVTTLKNVRVRYRGGVKSPVLEEVGKDETLIYRKNVDEWAEVQTASGVVGYVRTGDISEVYDRVTESTYKDELSSIRKDYKISLVWFQVGTEAGNSNIDGMLTGTRGINTISPTWYSVTDNSGNMSSCASSSFVSSMHNRGIEVWPLVNDFTEGLDSALLLGSSSARSRIIDRLMSDAEKYGYDGINIDFEKVSKSAGADFLQFVRELSVQCRRRNMVLSIDNYKAEAYNSHYDMGEQGVFADYIIIMGYDEHYAGSSSGSVASIGFVEDGIEKGLAYVPKEKLINAMPFYTRIWTEKDGTTTSTAVAMQTAIDDLSRNGALAIWDETAGQYFGSYEKDGGTVKIWVEEDRSIEEKLKLFQKYDLAGVAAWKLGLEKKSVWSVISDYTGT